MARVETRLETIESDVSELKIGQVQAATERSANHHETMAAIQVLAARVETVSAGQAGLVSTFRSALSAMPPTAWWIIGSAVTATLAGAFGYTYTAPTPPASITMTQSADAPPTPEAP